MLYSRPHRAEGGVEFELTGVELIALRFLEGHRVDAVDTDIAEIGHRHEISEQAGQAGGSERVRVVSGAVRAVVQREQLATA